MGSMTESQESLMKSICLTFMSERAGEEIFRLLLWVFGGDGVSLIVSYLAKAEFKFSGLSEYSETYISGLCLVLLLMSEPPPQFLHPSHLHSSVQGTPAW